MTPMQLSHLLARISAVVVLLLTLAACGAFIRTSTPTTFYTLTTLVPEEVDAVALGTAKRMTVSIGPVEIAVPGPSGGCRPQQRQHTENCPHRALGRIVA
jgi:hypothetical protein